LSGVPSVGAYFANFATATTGLPGLFKPNPLIFLGAFAPLGSKAEGYYSTAPLEGCLTRMHVVRLLAPALDGEDHTKDIDFTPAGVKARRAAGYVDTCRMVERAPWRAPTDPIEGVVEHT
jgi:NTE family protein